MKKVFDSWRNLHLSCGNLGEYLSSLSRSSPFMKRRRYLSLSSKSSPCMKKKSCNKRNHWNRMMMIPKDILEEIALKLSPLDILRMGKVCQRWKSIIESGDIRKPPKELDVPWLLLPQVPHSNQIVFYGFSSGRIYKIELPKLLQGCRCCGASKGWLLMVSCSNNTPSVPHLWNPISGETISLPSLETIQNFLVVNFRHGFQRKIRRIEVISVGSDQLIVAATFRTRGKLKTNLGFCRPKDRKWTILEGIEISFIADILFHNGVLYVLKQGPIQERSFFISVGDYEMRLVLISFEFRQHHPVGFPIVVNHPNFRIIRRSMNIPYLAESTRGELLLVSRILDSLEKHPTVPKTVHNIQRQTAGFEVYVINCEPGNYSSTFTRLQSLEDEALFVASSGSLSHGSGIDKNCINFLADQLQPSHGSGIFHLSESKVKRSLPSMNVPVQSSVGWFIPNFP